MVAVGGRLDDVKWAVGFVLASAVCSATACSPGRACTLIAAAPGIEVSVDPALDVTGGTLELCWDGRCRSSSTRTAACGWAEPYADRSGSGSGMAGKPSMLVPLCGLRSQYAANSGSDLRPKYSACCVRSSR